MIIIIIIANIAARESVDKQKRGMKMYSYLQSVSHTFSHVHIKTINILNVDSRVVSHMKMSMKIVLPQQLKQLNDCKERLLSQSNALCICHSLFIDSTRSRTA